MALHQSPDSPTIYVAEVKLTPGMYIVDILRAKKPKGGTWERLPRSPFEIVIADPVTASPCAPSKTNSDNSTHLAMQNNSNSGVSVTELKLATSAKSVPLSKMTLPRLPSVLSTPPSPPSPSSACFSFVDKETVSSAISAALNTKKLSSVEPVISWTVIFHGLLACVYVGFLITKTLREWSRIL